MKFKKRKIVYNLNEGKTYNGTIFDISKVKNGDYYDIKIDTSGGIISIWVSDFVNPDHPLFEVFDAFIENEEDAEDFNEKEIIGTEIQFTVKNIATKSKKGQEIIRSYFDKVTPIFEEMEEN